MPANLDQTHWVKSVIGTWEGELKVGLLCWLFPVERKGADIPNTAEAQAPQNHLILKSLGCDLLQD